MNNKDLEDFIDTGAFSWCNEQNSSYINRVDKQNYEQFVYCVMAFCAGMLATAAIAMIVLR